MCKYICIYTILVIQRDHNQSLACLSEIGNLLSVWRAVFCADDLNDSERWNESATLLKSAITRSLELEQTSNSSKDQYYLGIANARSKLAMYHALERAIDSNSNSSQNKQKVSPKNVKWRCSKRIVDLLCEYGLWRLLIKNYNLLVSMALIIQYGQLVLRRDDGDRDFAINYETSCSPLQRSEKGRNCKYTRELGGQDKPHHQRLPTKADCLTENQGNSNRVPRPLRKNSTRRGQIAQWPPRQQTLPP